MELSRYGGSLTITPVLAMRPPPPAAAATDIRPHSLDEEVVVVEVEPDIITEDYPEDISEDEVDEEEELARTSFLQPTRYGTLYPLCIRSMLNRIRSVTRDRIWMRQRLGTYCGKFTLSNRLKIV
jgi:hypothetical protein